MNDFDNDVEIIYFVCFILLTLEFNDQTKTIGLNSFTRWCFSTKTKLWPFSFCFWRNKLRNKNCSWHSYEFEFIIKESYVMGISELFLLSTACIHGVYDKEILKIVSITSDLVFLYCGGGRHFVVFYSFH